MSDATNHISPAEAAALALRQGRVNTSREYVLRIACPEWLRDGLWPPPWESPCQHLRLEIGLPLSVDKFVGLINGLGPCDCGRALVVLTSCPPSRNDPEPAAHPSPDPS